MPYAANQASTHMGSLLDCQKDDPARNLATRLWWTPKHKPHYRRGGSHRDYPRADGQRKFRPESWLDALALSLDLDSRIIVAVQTIP